MNREEATDWLCDFHAASIENDHYAMLGETGIDVEDARKKYIKLKQRIIAALCEDKWIPIKGLPEQRKTFLVWLPDNPVPAQTGRFLHALGCDWFIGNFHRYPLSEGKVTHYQPLPEGPREEG